MLFSGEFDRFVNGRMRRCLRAERTGVSRAKNVPKIRLQTSRAAILSDPKVQKRKISQHAIKELKGKCAIGLSQLRFRPAARDDRVGEHFFGSPSLQRGERDPRAEITR